MQDPQETADGVCPSSRLRVSSIPTAVHGLTRRTPCRKLEGIVLIHVCSDGAEYYRGQILRDIGLNAYSKAVSLMHGPDAAWFRRLVEDIQEHYVGPDCYWKDPESAPPKPGFTRYFGNAWWIPFPPTLVRALLAA